MSDQLVRAAVEQMEAWLTTPAWQPDSESLAQWNATFQGALARAEKGPGWADLVARGRAVSLCLDIRTEQLVHERDAVKAELDAQERGHRALRGYGASTS